MENKIINEVLEQTKKVNQLENVYQSIYEKFDVKIDKLKNRRDEALGMAWNAFTKEKAKLEELLKQRKEELWNYNLIYRNQTQRLFSLE